MACENCPNCGTWKHQVMACHKCGFKRSNHTSNYTDRIKIKSCVNDSDTPSDKNSKKSKRKINWNAIPLIKKQKREKEKLRKILKKAKASYRDVPIKIISGGAGPGTGKKR